MREITRKKRGARARFARGNCEIDGIARLSNNSRISRFSSGRCASNWLINAWLVTAANWSIETSLAARRSICGRHEGPSARIAAPARPVHAYWRSCGSMEYLKDPRERIFGEEDIQVASCFANNFTLHLTGRQSAGRIEHCLFSLSLSFSLRAIFTRFGITRDISFLPPVHIEYLIHGASTRGRMRRRYLPLA